MLETDFSQHWQASYRLGEPMTSNPMTPGGEPLRVASLLSNSLPEQLTPTPPQIRQSLSTRRLMTGDRLNNTLAGTAAADRIRGGGGNDRIRGLGGADWLSGDAGNDRLFGGAGNDRLLGGSGNNQLRGNAGNDQLLGGRGNDRLLGGAGADLLTGNGGTDQMTGGANGDRFVLRSGKAQLAKAAVITDFTSGEDRLDFGQTSPQQIRLMAGTGQLNGSTIIQNAATGEYLAILQGVRTEGLTIALLQNLPSDPPAPPAITPSPIDPPVPPISPFAPTASVQRSAVAKFAPSDPEATIAATGAASIRLGTQTIYIGTQQVSSINQNPIIASFDSSNPANRWVRTDYEITGADGRGYGLFWSGSDLYAVFSVDGTQGTPDQDFRRASVEAVQPWLRSYGRGGGPKVAVIARLNLATGEMTEAAYLSAVLNDGRTNSLEITALSQNSAGNLVISANSWFAPRRPDGTAMTQTSPGSSPFSYMVEIAPNLRSVISTAAIGWT